MEYNPVYRRLLSIIKDKALQHGEFTLSNGEVSNVYIDLRKVVATRKGLSYITELLNIELEKYRGQSTKIGGPVIGSTPIVTSLLLHDKSFFDGLFMIRKENIIEGDFEKGNECILVEDVTNTGISLLNAIKTVESHGGLVKSAFSVMDRNNGAKALFKQEDIEFKSLFSVEELLHEIR